MHSREVLASDELRRAAAAVTLNDAFGFLGPHGEGEGALIRAFLPGAASVEAVSRTEPSRAVALHPVGSEGLFAAHWDHGPYFLRIDWHGVIQETEDPYSFGFVLPDDILARFASGTLWDLSSHLGAVARTAEGVSGVSFAVWAPNAHRVSVVGDFNSWDGRRHPMRMRYPSGVWEIFIPRIGAGERYKFEIATSHGTLLKADPVARATECPPATASIVAPALSHAWTDSSWLSRRSAPDPARKPISIYEVHAGSWLRPVGNPAATLDWRALAERLIPYVQRMGFTHVEFLPIMEHPFAGSWGYQPLSQFAPSARFGSAGDFAKLVDACHAAGLGVILDWVPAHFPSDAHGLVHFDGTALYEHADPQEGFHPDWNTCIFNLGRTEVQGFLIASALHWLKHFHVDGLRVDAVASMLYRDYSRKSGEWRPNIHGGRENLEAIAFLRRLNEAVRAECPGALMIAEESTAWPGVSAPVDQGGLGFSFKWNMGWMHDTLTYMGKEPVHRRWHHGDMTFGLLYAYSERFVLPLSHDEVVHGKGSLYGRMPGDDWQKRANLRAYLTFMWAHPGKKLLFMGGEIAQPAEWNHDGEIAWDLVHRAGHAGIQRLVAELNALYRAESALHASDSEPSGFAWIVGDDSENSVFAFLRRDEAQMLLIVVNFTPIPRKAYRIGVPTPGKWRCLLNSDAARYGGSDYPTADTIEADAWPSHGHGSSLVLDLPPLAGLVLRCP